MFLFIYIEFVTLAYKLATSVKYLSLATECHTHIDFVCFYKNIC